MKTSFFKRGVAAFLALVLCAASIAGATSVYAVGEQAQVYKTTYPREGDANYDADWGHPRMEYMNGWSSQRSGHITLRAMGAYEGAISYCIEPGVSQDNLSTLTQWDESFWDNYPAELNHTITPDEIKTFIGRIFQYGYTGNISQGWMSHTEGADTLAYAVATQLLIWEVVVGERDSEFQKVDPGAYDAVLDQISTGNPLYSQIMAHYAEIEYGVQHHTTLPSFMARTPGSAQTVELEWDGSQYRTVLTDDNGVVGSYTFSSDDGLNFSVEGNQLIITAPEAPNGTLTVTAYKDAERRGIITWTDGVSGHTGVQDVATYAETVSDPVRGFVKLNVSYGSARIIKTSEDGNVEGISFTISGTGWSRRSRLAPEARSSWRT